MTLKALAAALAGALVAASVALAAPADDGGKGKGRDGTGTSTTTTTARGDAALLGCARTRELELKGAFVSAGPDSFAMLVSGGSRHARVLKGKQVTVMTNARTLVRRRGHATLADLVAGDRLSVHARTCRTTGGDTTAPPKLLARKVDAKPKKATPTTTATS